MAERFYVASFATVIAQLRESALIANISHPSGPSPKDVVRSALDAANEQFKELKLSRVL